MYYMLNFTDHTFQTIDKESDLADKLTEAQDKNIDLTNIEIIDCSDDSIRTDGQTYFSRMLKEAMATP